MERFIQLNLRNDNQKAGTLNFPEPEHKEPDSSVIHKKLKRLGEKAAHKAATKLGRNKLGIFSK